MSNLTKWMFTVLAMLSSQVGLGQPTFEQLSSFGGLTRLVQNGVNNNVLIWSEGHGSYNLIRSTDDGVTWIFVGRLENWNDSPLPSICIDRTGKLYFTRLYTGEFRTFSTTNNGINWINEPIFCSYDLKQHRVFSDGRHYVMSYEYLQIDTSKLFISTNDGVSWVSRSIPVRFNNCLAITPNHTILCSGSLPLDTGWAPDHYVARSTDNGENWQTIAVPGPFHFNDMEAVNDTVILASGSAWTGLYRSLDGGLHWQSVPGFELVSDDFSIDSLGRIYVQVFRPSLNRSDLARSTDFGTTWTYFSPNLISEYPTFGVSQSGTIIRADEATYRSTDQGVNWIECFSAFEAYRNEYWLETNNGSMITADLGLLISRDHCTTWQTITRKICIDGRQSIGIKGICKKQNGRIILATNDDIFRSNDHGENWSRDTAQSTGDFCYLPDGTEIRGNQYSTNQGCSWHLISENSIIGCDSSNTIYQLTFSNDTTYLERSSNLGTSWHRTSQYQLLNEQPLKIWSGHAVFAQTARGHFKSNNGGVDWLTVPFLLSNQSINCFLDNIQGDLFIIENNTDLTSNIHQYVKRLLHNNSHWETLLETSESDYKKLYLDSMNCLYYSNYRSTASVTSSELVEFHPVVETFQLTTFPNPFNSILHIRLSLPTASMLRLEIFNVLGKSVAVVACDQYSSGFYQFNWHSEKFASGKYFIHLRVNNSNRIYPISLIK